MSAQRHRHATAKIRECEVAVRAALAEQLAWIAEVDRMGTYAEDGARSMRVWLREVLNLGESEAKTRVVLADALPERTVLSGAAVDPAFPATGEAVRSGTITLEHARVIVEGVRALPSTIPESTRADAEAQLAEMAPRFAPRQLRTLAERIRYLADQDGALRDEEHQLDQRRLHLGTGRDGMTVVNGRLDRESGAQLRAVLDSLAAPRPAEDGTKDPRDAGQRHADALATAMDLLISGDGLPSTGGTRPRLTITVDYADLRAELAQSVAGGSVDNTGQPITAAQIRRLACDAEILPVVLDSDGVPPTWAAPAGPALAPLRAALVAPGWALRVSGLRRSSGHLRSAPHRAVVRRRRHGHPQPRHALRTSPPHRASPRMEHRDG